jgi:hypothetical protein
MRRAAFSVAILAVALAGCVQPPPPASAMADRVIVQKSKRTLELLRDGKVFASFPVALGWEPRGAKQQEGDGRTPEGAYRVDYKSMQSRYTRALHVDRAPGGGVGGRCRSRFPAGLAGYVRRPRRAT